MSYIKQNMEQYSSMIKSEVGYASTNDYFSRKTRFDRQEFAETTEIIGKKFRKYLMFNLYIFSFHFYHMDSKLI